TAGGTISNFGTLTDDRVEITWNNIETQKVSVTYTDTNGCIPSTPSELDIWIWKVPSTGNIHHIPSNFSD
ncbi:MAG: hypothetical protein MI922_06885, partial [Bacteroidales bacterium]|nr:hypothetical protein [Bacteroidales bacterium]